MLKNNKRKFVSHKYMYKVKDQIYRLLSYLLQRNDFFFLIHNNHQGLFTRHQIQSPVAVQCTIYSIITSFDTLDYHVFENIMEMEHLLQILE